MIQRRQKRASQRKRPRRAPKALVPLGSLRDPWGFRRAARAVRAPRPAVVFIMGPPGSGKSTQAQVLGEQFGLERIKTGSILRELGKRSSVRGRSIKERIDVGRLAPPPLVAELVIRKLRRVLARSAGAVFDGSPRTLHEAELLLDALKCARAPRVLVVSLDVPQQETVRRIMSRWVCEGCKREIPPGDVTLERCVACGGKVVRREDDREHIVSDRWTEYAFRTLPVIRYLERRGLVTRVNGDRPILDVQAEVRQRVTDFLKPRVTSVP